MSESHVRPMKVVVAPRSKAEAYSRKYRTGVPYAPDPLTPHEIEREAIAPGFVPRPSLDLQDFHGRIIRDLVYTNFYVGGQTSWDPNDIQAIDTRLAGAMSDRLLNKILLQYFRGNPSITSAFRPSSILPGPAPALVTQPDVENLVRTLHGQGKLNGFDFRSSVFNLLLPRRTVLRLDEGGSVETPRPTAQGSAPPHEVEEKASSLEGLGGFHGSVHIGTSRIYYAVGVFSEGNNGIVAFDRPWKNVVATFYHELVEARTDSDVEDQRVAWVNARGEEIGDIPMALAGPNLAKVMKEVPLEVPLSDGSCTVPIQLMWSNMAHGPEGP